MLWLVVISSYNEPTKEYSTHVYAFQLLQNIAYQDVQDFDLLFVLEN